MARAEHEPITGVWGQEPPAGSRGRAPGQGVRGAKPPEAKSILVIGCPTEPTNLAPVRENSMVCYGPLVSELGGGQSAWGPQPRHWGACTPPAPPPMFTSIHLCAVHGTEARYAVLVSHEATGLGCLTA